MSRKFSQQDQRTVKGSAPAACSSVCNMKKVRNPAVREVENITFCGVFKIGFERSHLRFTCIRFGASDAEVEEKGSIAGTAVA